MSNADSAENTRTDGESTRRWGERLTTLPALSTHPLVSVIVPSYNHDTYLKETLESILCQEYDHIEIIVVDGASTDGTLEILRRYDNDPRLRWISEPDSGPIEALNKGFKMARGELIGILPVTDTYHPGALQEIVTEFVGEREAALVGGWTQQIDENSTPTGVVTMLRTERFDYSVDDIVQWANIPRTQATLFRLDIILGMGGADEQLLSHGAFLLRYMLEASRLGGKIRAIPRVWANYRLHSNPLHTSPAYNPLQIYVERNRFCTTYAEMYRHFLTPRQARLLRRTGYYFELRHRIRVLGQTVSAIPTALRYAWFGGAPVLIRYLWHRLMQVIKSCIGLGTQ